MWVVLRWWLCAVSAAGSPPDVVWLVPSDAALAELARQTAAVLLQPDAVVVAQPTPKAEPVRLCRPGKPSTQQVTVLVDERPDVAVLYVCDHRAGRLWARDIERGEAAEQPWAEAVGVAASGALRAVLAGEAPAMTRVPVEPEPSTKTTVPVTASQAKRRWLGSVAARVGYRGSYLARSHPWTHGIDLSVAVTWPMRIMASLGVEILWPIVGGSDEASIRLSRHPIRAGLGYMWPVGEHVSLSPSLFAMVDITRRTASIHQSGLRANAPALYTDVALAPALSVRAAPIPWLFAYVDARLELWLTRREYTVDVPQTQVLVAPGIVRPTVSIGLGGVFARPRGAP